MSTIEESIDVAVPVRTAYNQWTQFEDFPQFMEGVEEVRQLDDTTTRWVVEVAGRRREFEAKVTEQDPDQRVAWSSVEGSPQAGVVTFHRLGEGLTRVMLQMEVEPEGPAEKVGDLLGVVKRRAKGDLKRFKEFIEARGEATGAWRGEVEQDPSS
ncbi:MAG: SRPBCC family protein [Actinomycetota bacterium]|nr:SRPBCC family protein [Actinomycetota bacterium]